MRIWPETNYAHSQQAHLHNFLLTRKGGQPIGICNCMANAAAAPTAVVYMMLLYLQTILNIVLHMNMCPSALESHHKEIDFGLPRSLSPSGQ